METVKTIREIPMRIIRKIKAFQAANQFVVEIYRCTRLLPKEEVYGLTSQIRRAAILIPANIAEGASRQHKRDYLSFLYIARGSLAETECLLQLANQLGYLTGAIFIDLSELCNEVAEILYGLISAVEREVNL